MALKSQSKFIEAEPLFREALEIRRAAFPAGHVNIATSLNNLGADLQAQSQFTEAEPLFREALVICPAGSPDVLLTRLLPLRRLADLLIQTGRPAEAAPLIDECVDGNTRAFGGAHENTRRAISLAVTLYESWDQAEPGKGYAARAAEWKAKLHAIDRPTPENPAEKK